MINNDLLAAAKVLLVNLKATRADTDALNTAFMAAMDQPDNVSAVRALFPEIIRMSETSAAVISGVFLSVDWEKEGNTPDVLYSLLAGEGEIPDEIKPDLEQFLADMEVTEKAMEERFGKDAIISCIRSLGLEQELVDLINSRDEVQALAAAMASVPGMPVVQE